MKQFLDSQMTKVHITHLGQQKPQPDGRSEIPSLSSGFSSSLEASMSSSSWAETVEATLSHWDTSRSSRGFREA